MDDSTRDEEVTYKALGEARFLLAVAGAIVTMEYTGGPVTRERFLRLVQRTLDGHFVPVDAVLSITHSDTTAQKLMGTLRRCIEDVAPLVQKYADES